MNGNMSKSSILKTLGRAHDGLLARAKHPSNDEEQRNEAASAAAIVMELMRELTFGGDRPARPAELIRGQRR